MAARYDRDMIRQIEGLTTEKEGLKCENKELCKEKHALRAETVRLRNKVETLEGKLEELETTMEDRIQQVVEQAVANAVQPLKRKIEEKDREIKRLKSQVSKNSSNSSKPPGSDRFSRIPNNRDLSSKKRGKKGHKGHMVRMPKNLDELVQKGVAEHIIRTYRSGKAVCFGLDHRHKGGCVLYRTPKKSWSTAKEHLFVLYPDLLQPKHGGVNRSPYKTEDSVREDGILTQCHGIVAQDHEANFYKFGDRHAACGAHLLREQKGLNELYLQ